MNRLSRVIRDAKATLNPRARYAQAVITGDRLWSGADIKGHAKRWSSSYALQRAKARYAVEAAGGLVLPINHGFLVTAVPVGQDDYGNALYKTTHGTAVQHTAAQARLVA